MITVILVCWKRFQHFEDIIKFWLRQKEVNQIIVFDNSGNFKTGLPILLFNINKNLGPLIRYVGVQFAKNDIIIFCDDDVKLEDGIIKDFLKYFSENKILGVLGLQYIGDTITECPKIKGRDLKEPIKVDYIPCNICMTHRKHCIVDIKEYPWGNSQTIWGGDEFYNKVPPVWIDDFWWRNTIKKKFPNVEHWVIPTKKYGWYPECIDKNAISKNPKVRKLLEEIYQKEIKPL